MYYKKACHPYAVVFTTQTQTIAPQGAVEFNDCGQICGVGRICDSVIEIKEGGIYSVFFELLASLGPSETSIDAAFAIEVNDVIQRETRFGLGFAGLAANLNVTVVGSGLLCIPSGGKIRVVNISDDPITLDNNQISTSVNTGLLQIQRN